MIESDELRGGELEARTGDEFCDLIERGSYDYIDFGCSKGASLQIGRDVLGGQKGLGIDIDRKKIELTRKAGYDAVKFDIHEIPDKKLVRFVIQSHFLEHVPDLEDVAAFIRKACSISTDFVYIRQPYFDADSYLARHGLKLFWSDWTGHPNRMTSLEFWILLRNLREQGLEFEYSIFYWHHISDSDDVMVHAISSPTDQFEYDENRHPAKGDTVRFTEPVFAEIRVLITMPGTDHAGMLRKLRKEYMFMNSRSEKPVNRFYHGRARVYKYLRALRSHMGRVGV